MVLILVNQCTLAHTPVWGLPFHSSLMPTGSLKLCSNIPSWRSRRHGFLLGQITVKFKKKKVHTPFPFHSEHLCTDAMFLSFLQRQSCQRGGGSQLQNPERTPRGAQVSGVVPRALGGFWVDRRVSRQTSPNPLEQ